MKVATPSRHGVFERQHANCILREVEKPVPKSRRRSSGRVMEKVLSTFKEERKWNSADYNPSWLLSRLAPTLLRK